MKAMERSKRFPVEGKVYVDETYVDQQDDRAIGRNEGKNRIADAEDNGGSN